MIARVVVAAALCAGLVAAASAGARLGRTGLFKGKGGQVDKDVRGIPPPKVPVKPSAIRLAIQAPSGTIWQGQCVLVILRVTNAGESRATGVKARIAADDGGAIISAMDGPVPAGPVVIEPGITQAFVWTCTMSGLGAVCFTGTVTGLDSLTEAPFALSVSANTMTKFPGALQAWLTASIAPPRLGDLVDLILSISNTGGCDVTGVTGALTFNLGAAAMVPMSGPTPSTPVTLAPGAIQTVVWTYSAAGLAYVNVTGAANGTDSGLVVPVWASGATEFTSFGGISTVAGVGSAGYNGDGIPATTAAILYPAGVAFDGSGNMYFAEYIGNRVRKVDAATGVISTVAGTGVAGYNGDGIPATSAKLCCPADVAIGPDGNLYIADECNYLIRKVDLSAGPPTISTVAGLPTAAGFDGDAPRAAVGARLNMPHAIAFDGSGNLYVADTYNNRIRMVVLGGVITTFAGGGGGGPGADPQSPLTAALQQPNGVAYDAATGSIYISDTLNNVIRKVWSGTIFRVAGTGVQSYGGDGGAATSAFLNYPYGIEVDSFGNVYFADRNNQRVRRIDAGGNMTTVAGTGTQGYNFDNVPGISAQLNFPWGIAVDAVGVVYIGDYNNNRVRKLCP